MVVLGWCPQNVTYKPKKILFHLASSDKVSRKMLFAEKSSGSISVEELETDKKEIAPRSTHI